jgi:hypothetical protein
MISFVWSVISSLVKLIILLRNYAKHLEKKPVIEESKSSIVEEIVLEKSSDLKEKPEKITRMSTEEILKDLIDKEEDEDFKRVLQKLMK